MKTSDWLLIIMISVVCASSVQGQFNVGADVLGELIRFPLTKNPFFAKVAGMAGKMDTDGILLNDTDMSGNNCHVLGNLQCEGGETPHCSGGLTNIQYQRLIWNNLSWMEQILISI